MVELDDLKDQPKQSSDSVIQRYQLPELLLECIDLFISSRQLMDLINFFQVSLSVEEGYNLSNQKCEWSQLKKNNNKLFREKKKQAKNLYIIAFIVIKRFLHCTQSLRPW